jgi:ubiquinone/menaquinone biosynthesis C-methylase UbiE
MASEDAGFTGNIPDYYDRGLGPVLFVDFADDIARRVAASRPGRVLEIAAGTGIATRRLRDLLPHSAALTATDLNPPMLEVARAKFRADEPITFQPADGTALPFPDGAFDAVTCQFGVMFFPDKAAAYREAHRVLAPGGRYVFSVWDAIAHNGFARVVQQIVGGFFPDDPPQFMQAPFDYHRLDPIKDALLDAGFGHIAISVLRREKEIADFALFTRGLIHGNPLVDQIRARGGVDPDAVVQAVASALGREFGADPCRLPLQTIVFEATRS